MTTRLIVAAGAAAVTAYVTGNGLTALKVFALTSMVTPFEVPPGSEGLSMEDAYASSTQTAEVLR